MPPILEGIWNTVPAGELIENVSFFQVHPALDNVEAAASKRVIVSPPDSPHSVTRTVLRSGSISLRLM